MGWLTGIGPATFGTTNRRSTTELQPPCLYFTFYDSKTQGSASMKYHMLENLLFGLLNRITAWYQFGFLIEAGSPLLGFIGKR